MRNPKYYGYEIFHKGVFLEVIIATNKKNALHFFGGSFDDRLKKDFTANRIIENKHQSKTTNFTPNEKNEQNPK